MQVTIHRGTKEIGGSCVELSCGDSRIVLDIGMPLVDVDGLSFDMTKYAGDDGAALVEKGVLPNITGIYSWDSPSVDAIFLSHAHQDHYGFLGFVHPEVPVYMSDGTRALIEITTLFTPVDIALGRVELFSWRDTIDVGAFHVTPHLVDHSCFSAFALEIEAGGKRIFYSGDFRTHGYIAPKAMKILYDRVKPGVDGLLMEGTMLGRRSERVRTEQELSDEATEVFRNTKGIVLIYQSGQNISRAVSFYKAAVKSGRQFVMDFYTAHVMGTLAQCEGGDKLPYPGKPRFDAVKVWYPKWLTSKHIEQGNQEAVYRHSKHKVTKEQMGAATKDMVVFVRPSVARDLDFVDNLPGGTLVYSMWDGYKNDDYTRRFLENLEKKGLAITTLHTSGHAEYSALKEMVDRLAPKLLLPIHTFYPDQFNDFGVDTLDMVDGEPISL